MLKMHHLNYSYYFSFKLILSYALLQATVTCVSLETAPGLTAVQFIPALASVNTTHINVTFRYTFVYILYLVYFVTVFLSNNFSSLWQNRTTNAK